MTLSALGIFSAAGAGGGPVGDYELIESQILGTTASSITFSSLATYASTYKHLQIRLTARDNLADNINVLFARLNGDTGTNYTSHLLRGNGSNVASFRSAATTYIEAGMTASNTTTANGFSSVVIDILDAFSSTKNTTTRSLSGLASNANDVRITSGLFINTASITSITLGPVGASFVSGSRFSLYGIR